ncbi:ester cyclase [Chitinophaga sp. GCM10012297]|uniref:Ester cyclase n=1 Tax=Chitinophaga chungangae TaxID=2821488 RepID=A0ABS3YF99_9BACT|nr:ester cyclase [Chitinophaga chungangae]MBO9153343.1 ester cyclase [Chitinophaga chungangae]
MKPFSLFLSMLMIPAASFAQADQSIPSSNKNNSDMNMNEQNKQTVRSLYEKSLNEGNLAILDQFVSEDYTGPRGEKGVAGFASNLAPLIRAFPDIHYELADLVAEGNKVMVSWKWSGTHEQEYNHIPATHKKVINTAIAVYELKDGKITGAQLQTDRLGFLQQLEALPQDVSQIFRQVSGEAVRFIDKFVIPASAKNEFLERANVNRQFIKNLPGFLGDEMYLSEDENGNIHCVTVAAWENDAALQQAKENVQAFYKKEGFNPAEMLTRLGITMDRAMYKKVRD